MTVVASTPTGLDIIADFAKNLPLKPGVYRMRDTRGEVLYVGKAKSLKRRVISYTRATTLSLRIRRMVSLTAAMEFTVTDSEAEALLLEAELIKSLKPRYNILLRDDKSFPSILIAADHPFPALNKHRGARTIRGYYFGPFASGQAVNETLDVLRKAFQLRNCTDNAFALRARPCLQYQIKRCTAPCVGKVNQTEYAAQVDLARRFLSGHSRTIQEDFTQRMQIASEAEDYETAAAWRDRIRALSYIQSQSTTSLEGVASADVFALHQDNGITCVQVFFIRSGSNFGHRPYFPRHEKEDKPGAILAAFIAQFYTNKPTPDDILLSHPMAHADVIRQALERKEGHKIRILCPTRGPKRDFIALALKNAAAALTHRLTTDAQQNAALERLATVFGLSAPPERVEVYDNSHTGGQNAVGTMIVVTPSGFQKNAYRKFNMRTAADGDDYAMMREMLTRRFKNPDLPRPDLVLLDGGHGQLSIVQKMMADLGLSDIPLAAIAKGPDRNAGRERFFLPGRAPFTLNDDSLLLHFLQRIRDEAHRFALTTHRARRAKTLVQSPLDAIPGIGSQRKKALLLHFGSAKAVAEATLSDLQKVKGMSTALAQTLYNFFHEGN